MVQLVQIKDLLFLSLHSCAAYESTSALIEMEKTGNALGNSRQLEQGLKASAHQQFGKTFPLWWVTS